MLTPLPALAVLLGTLVIGSDLYARRVPNTWLLAVLLLAAAILGMSWVEDGANGPPRAALSGLLIGLVVMLPAYRFGVMGAGDVKFFAVMGFLLGAKALLPIWIIGSLLTGAHAVVIAVARRTLGEAVPGGAGSQSWLATSAWGRRITAARQGRAGLPYAAWLAVGAVTTVFVPSLLSW